MIEFHKLSDIDIRKWGYRLRHKITNHDLPIFFKITSLALQHWSNFETLAWIEHIHLQRIAKPNHDRTKNRVHILWDILYAYRTATVDDKIK